MPIRKQYRVIFFRSIIFTIIVGMCGGSATRKRKKQPSTEKVKNLLVAFFGSIGSKEGKSELGPKQTDLIQSELTNTIHVAM